MTRKWRRKEVFRGPVQFGSSGNDDSRDINFYGVTAAANMRFDVSANELFLNGVDLWLKDDDQLEFGDSSDVVIDWSTTDGLMLLPAAANNDFTLGSATYYMDADWNLGVVDMDLYGTAGGIDVNRNLTSGVTSTPVMKITQDNSSDDQVAVHIVQDATAAALLVAPTSTGVALDINGGVDIDGVSTFTSGALVNITRNLTSGSTDNVVLYVKQDSTTDDKAAVQIVQDAAVAALDVDGNVDIDGVAGGTTGSLVDINRDLASGSTDAPVVAIKQDNTGDDQVALIVTQDAPNYLALDVVGYTDLGYVTTEPTNATVATGAIRVYKASTNTYLSIHTGSGTWKFMNFDLTTGGLS